MGKSISRRDFLKISAMGAVGAAEKPQKLTVIRSEK